MWPMTLSYLSLEEYLSTHHCADGLMQIVLELSKAAEQIAAHIAQIGLTSTQMGLATGDTNIDGDQQKQLDVIADDIICSAMQKTGLVQRYYSEEKEDAILCTPQASYDVACDPLDGSSNIENNLTIGTIFSIFQHPENDVLPQHELPQGRAQKIAGFFCYGPQTSLIMTCGHGVAGFAPNEAGIWQQLDWDIHIPPTTAEFAINSANARFWPEHIAAYIADCLAGKQGNRERDFNMRWLGSLVADSYRIFRRGGVFLYPEDSRPKYHAGRLRLIYEAYPIAFLTEQAGGKASDGQTDILDIAARELHQRIPLIFGSADEVDIIIDNYTPSKWKNLP